MPIALRLCIQLLRDELLFELILQLSTSYCTGKVKNMHGSATGGDIVLWRTFQKADEVFSALRHFEFADVDGNHLHRVPSRSVDIDERLDEMPGDLRHIGRLCVFADEFDPFDVSKLHVARADDVAQGLEGLGKKRGLRSGGHKVVLEDQVRFL